MIQERIKLESYARDVFEKANLMYQQAQNQQTSLVLLTYAEIVTTLREMAALAKLLDPVTQAMSQPEYESMIKLSHQPAAQVLVEKLEKHKPQFRKGTVNTAE
jgi:hypothetical protein